MKKILKILFVFLAIVLVLGFVLNRLLSRQLSAERLEELLEEELSADVSLDSVKLRPYIFPKSVSLKEVVFHESRLSEEGQRALAAEELRLAVSLGALFKKELLVEEFVLVKPEIRLVLREDGTNNFEELIEKPFEKGQKGEKDRNKITKPKEPQKEKEKTKKGSDAESFGSFVARLKEARIIDGQVNVLIEESGTVIRIDNLEARLHEILVDPAALGKTNEARLDLAGKVSVKNPASHLPPFLGLDLDGSAELKLFDEQTHDLSPEVAARLSILEGSHLDTRIPIVQKIVKELHRLEKVGVDIGELPDKLVFGSSQGSRFLAGRYEKGTLSLDEPLQADYGSWQFRLEKGGWIGLSQETHEIQAALLASSKISSKADRALSQLGKYIPKELGGGSGLAGQLFANDRLSLKLSSSGSLKKPKVRPDYELPDASLDGLLNEELSDKLEKKAESFFKKIF